MSVNQETTTFCADCKTRLISPKDSHVIATLKTPKEEPARGAIFVHRYEIIEELGKGGRGRIYLVHDNKLDRHVAIKFLDE